MRMAEWFRVIGMEEGSHGEVRPWDCEGDGYGY